MPAPSRRRDDADRPPEPIGRFVPDNEPLVDADTLLALTAELRELRGRVERAKVSAEQRSRWQRTLAAIAEGGSADLERARQQLTRLGAQLDRVPGA